MGKQTITQAGAEVHIFRSRDSAHLFVVDGSRIYDIESETANRLDAWLTSGTPLGDLDENELWSALGLFSQNVLPRYVGSQPLEPPPSIQSH
jgi:uncharacterized protein